MKDSMQNKESLKLCFEGDLSIVSITDWKKNIILAVKAATPLQISFGPIESVDITFIQILFSLRLTLKKKNILFQFEQPIPEPLVDFMNEYGFDSNLLVG